MSTKWGIVSTGRISTDFVSSLKQLSPEEHLIVAVAASQKPKAEKFAKKFGIKVFYGTYEELAKDENVEIVYVGTVHSTHFEIAKTMLENGKHVLCEVPFCINSLQTKQLISLARSRNKFLMEAMISRCLPLFEVLKKQMENGAIGEVKQITAFFGLNLRNPDLKGDRRSGGGILCFAFHLIQLAILVFKELYPTDSYIAAGINKEAGFDEYGHINMKFGHHKLATFVYSTVQKLPNEAFIVGTKGMIKIHSPFWVPSKISVNGVVYTTATDDGIDYNYDNDSLLKYEAECVRNCLLTGSKECSKYSLSESLAVAEIADKLRTMLGINFL